MNEWTKLKQSALFGFLAALGLIQLTINLMYYSL